ncbi:MAG: FAD binding domain-containing protein [Candidatus Promineifilaceae bacterium]|nr:FAD binding domain-containing protein [Candidatus Promineifilaceae bacterium]
MALWQQYHRPETVDATLELLARYKGEARLVAGGTDLLLEMQQGHRPPVEALIDITAVQEMCALQQTAGFIEVGAAVPHRDIVRSELIRQQATCLVESCGVIGGPQVRNVGTLGGNVAHALPAADGTTALVALDGEAEVAALDAEGRSWRPILALFHGPGQSAVDQSRELITRFRFPAATPDSGSAFKRIMRPQGVALPILACAVWVKIDPASGPDAVAAPDDAELAQTVIEDARLCLGPVRPVPSRATQAEAALQGRSLAQALADCVTAAQEQFSPRTSKHRATAAYRNEMMAVLLRRALPLAVRRAVTGEAIPEGVGLQ